MEKSCQYYIESKQRNCLNKPQIDSDFCHLHKKFSADNQKKTISQSKISSKNIACPYEVNFDILRLILLYSISTKAKLIRWMTVSKYVYDHIWKNKSFWLEKITLLCPEIYMFPCKNMINSCKMYCKFITSYKIYMKILLDRSSHTLPKKSRFSKNRGSFTCHKDSFTCHEDYFTTVADAEYIYYIEFSLYNISDTSILNFFGESVLKEVLDFKAEIISEDREQVCIQNMTDLRCMVYTPDLSYNKLKKTMEEAKNDEYLIYCTYPVYPVYGYPPLLELNIRQMCCLLTLDHIRDFDL